MKKIMLLAFTAMLFIAAPETGFAQDKKTCKKECCEKCDEKGKCKKCCRHKGTQEKKKDAKTSNLSL